MTNIILSQIFGILAIITNSLSLQIVKKSKMMFFLLIANVFYVTQYFLLGAYTASITNIIIIIRTMLFNKYDNSNQKIPMSLLAIIIALCLIALAITYNGVLSFIPIIITIAYTIGATYNNPKKFKIIYGICAIIWLIYNFKVQAYVGMIGNFLEIISAYTAIMKKQK